jgi:type II secretory pathway component GspD/PulD (secretin)
MSLEVRPLVSSDRKYVTLDFEPMLVKGDLTAAAIQTASNLILADGGDGVIVYDLPLGLVIQLPSVEVVQARTRVMIPDGGSIIVGGLRRLRRETSKAQVPLLGNIPFVGRLFGRRGRYEDNRELHLLVSAKIFIYPELETQL